MSIIHATKKGYLPLNNLSKIATEAHTFPHLKSSSLLSLGQLCDDGCDVLLNRTSLHVFRNAQHILQGQRNYIDGPWDVPVAVNNSNNNKLNIIINKRTTKSDLINFFHGAYFSPSKRTLLQAIKMETSSAGQDSPTNKPTNISQLP